MSNVEFRMYETLRKHWTDEEATDFVQSLDERVAIKIELMKNELATKDDLTPIKADIVGIKTDIEEIKKDIVAVKADIVDLRGEMKVGLAGLTAEIAGTKTGLKAEMAE